MHTKLMVGVMMLAFPSGALAADATTPAAQASNSGVSQTAEQAAASLPPAPQGPFFSRRVAQNQGGFPPMGFDPMSNDVLPSEDSAVAQNTMPPPGPGMMPPRPGNAFGNNLGNGTEVQVEVRGRIGLAGRGAGNGGNGFGNNGFGNFMRGMPYGMPYSQGYGAPYGTPFNHAGTMGQYAPEPAQQAAPGASDAPAPASDQNPAQNTGQYPWNPGAMAPGGMAMPNPGGFFAQPQQAPGGNTSPPQPPEEPQWVKDSRAEADKLREQTQQRMAEMQKNNPYAQPYQPYGQGAYGQGYGAPYGAPYGTPYGNPYGGPYGQPFAQPYGYAPQPQAAPQASDPAK